jgi:hypothetical protein
MRQIPLLPRSNRARLALAIAAAIILGLIISLFLRTGPSAVVISAPAGNEAPPAASEPPLNATNSQLILELFNPSDQSLTHQLTTSALTQQIEQALTVSFVLTKCGTMSQEEYRDNFRALILYAQRTHLAADAAGSEKLVRHIAESAGTSYALIYSRTSCRDPKLQAMADQLASWRATILTPP